MTRNPVTALWRGAALRLVRTPGWFVLVVLGATLLVASSVAPSLFVSAARSTALDDGLEEASAGRVGTSGDLRLTWDAVLPASDDCFLVGEIDGLPGYSAPELGALAIGQDRRNQARAVAGGQSVPAALWYHDGVLEALSGEPSVPGIWLAEEAAATLGIGPGDPVRVGLQPADGGPDGGLLADTVLAGTFATPVGEVLPVAVQDLPGVETWVLPADPQRPGSDAPLAITSRDEFTRLVLEVEESPLYTADVRLDAGITPDEADATVAAVAQLGEDAFDVRSEVGGALDRGLPLLARLEIGTALAAIVQQSDASARSARVQVRPYAVAGQVMAAGLLVALWVLVGRSRRREQLLVSDLGVRPVEVGALALLEVVLAVVLAVPAGLGLALLGVSVTGPTEAAVALGGDDVVRGAQAALGGLALVAVAAVLGAVVTDRRSWFSRLGRGRRPVPWRAGVLVATAVVFGSVLLLEPQQRSESLVAVLLPLLVAASAALLVVPAVAWTVARSPGSSRAGGPRWLARRRSGTVGRDVAALTAVLGVGLGAFGYCLSVRAGIEAGVADKSAAIVGARSSVELDQELRGGGVELATRPPVAGSTPVWRADVTLPPAFGEQALIAIDTATFEDVADWGRSGVLDQGRALLDELDREGPRLPVILAGRTDLEVGHRGTISVNGEPGLAYEVIGVLPAFPGSAVEPTDVALVTSTSLLMRLLPPEVNPVRPGPPGPEGGAFRSVLWSDDTAAGLGDSLAAAGIEVEEIISRDGQRVRNGLVASTWAASYLLTLAAVLLAVSVAAALVLVLRLRERDIVSDVVLQRMGYPGAELARGRWWEVAWAAGTALLAATLTVLVFRLAPTTIDQTTRIAPLARPQVGATLVLVVVGVVLLLLVTARLVGAHSTRRRTPAEVLREYA